MLSNFYIPIFEYFDDPITNWSVVGPGLMRCWGSVGSVNSSQIRLNNPTQAERSNPLSKFPKLTYLILLRNWHGNIFKKYNDNSTKQTVFFLSFQNLYISSLHLTKRSLAIKNKKKTHHYCTVCYSLSIISRENLLPSTHHHHLLHSPSLSLRVSSQWPIPRCHRQTNRSSTLQLPRRNVVNII